MVSALWGEGVGSTSRVFSNLLCMIKLPLNKLLKSLIPKEAPVNTPEFDLSLHRRLMGWKDD